MSFFSWLSDRVSEIDSLLCVGLDPHPSDLPAATPDSARDFCLRLIEATRNVAAAYKPNIAFFEIYGPEGISALQQVIGAIPARIPVILDAKRGDIASTAEAYALAAFKSLSAHAITINPYLGWDSIEPYISDPERGAFLLCKTSNPGASDLQDLGIKQPLYLEAGQNAEFVYEKVALMAQELNIRDNLGLVVGANQPKALGRVRSLVPDMWILAPGVGVQGGDLSDALVSGLRKDGSGLLLPISRSIARSADPGQAAEGLRQKINDIRRKNQGSPGTGKFTTEDRPHPGHNRIADHLLSAGCIKFGEFTLKSGKISPIYIDLRQLISNPRLLDEVAESYITIMKGLTFDLLAGIPYAGLPIATAISIRGGWPQVYPRKEVKAYGTKAEIEGLFTKGQRAAVIDDLATTGESKLDAIEKLTSAGLIVNDIVVLIDRQSGASEALAGAGYKLHAVMTLTDLLNYYETSGKVEKRFIKATREFLSKNT